MKLLMMVVLCSSIALAGEPASDAPTKEEPVCLTPDEAKAEARRVLTCEADLRDCQSQGKVSPLWLTVGIAAGVLAGVGIGVAVTVATRR